MAVRRETEQPDAFVYLDDAGNRIVLCAHCTVARTMATADAGYAFHNAQQHLWSTHSLRRTWIDYSDPRYRDMVNVALPLVLAHNTSRPA